MTNLVFENRMKPNYSLVPDDPAEDLMNDMTAEMETPDRNFVTIDETELPDDAEVICIEVNGQAYAFPKQYMSCLLYTSPSPRDKRQSRMPSSA